MDFNRTELRAMLFGTGLLLLGAAARLGLAPAPATVDWSGAAGSESEGAALADVQSEVAAALAAESVATVPLKPGERLDPNTASVLDLRRLPGIGPAKAEAIVSERTSGGPFLDLSDLTRVPGIGPTTTSALAPLLTLRVGRSRAADASGGGAANFRSRVDVNRAQIKELEQITGIGPVLAARIVETRLRYGRFRGPEDLIRVPGIGPTLLQRIRGEVRF